MKKTNLHFPMWLVVLLLVAGCSAKTEPQQKILFPPLPDEPHYEWLNTIRAPEDFNLGKKTSFTTLMVGEDQTPFFAGPIDLAATSDGRILVSDLYQRSIKSIDMQNSKVQRFSDNNFENNLGVAVDAQDRVYVADGKVRKVLVFSGSGQPLYAIGGEDVFDKPSFLAINNKLSRLYVSDAVASDIKVFSLDGDYLFSFAEKGNGEGELYGPQGLAIDGEGRLYVADMLNARIQVFSADGEFVKIFGERGNQPYQFESPKGLAFDSEGNLYVADVRRPNFRVFTPDGTLLLMIGGNTRSTHKLGFSMPGSVYVDGRDRVLIGDFLNSRVTVWQYLSETYKAAQGTKDD